MIKLDMITCVAVIGGLLALVINYWLMRLAVRGGIEDAPRTAADPGIDLLPVDAGKGVLVPDLGWQGWTVAGCAGYAWRLHGLHLPRLTWRYGVVPGGVYLRPAPLEHLPAGPPGGHLPRLCPNRTGLVSRVRPRHVPPRRVRVEMPPCRIPSPVVFSPGRVVSVFEHRPGSGLAGSPSDGRPRRPAHLDHPLGDVSAEYGAGHNVRAAATSCPGDWMGGPRRPSRIGQHGFTRGGPVPVSHRPAPHKLPPRTGMRPVCR